MRKPAILKTASKVQGKILTGFTAEEILKATKGRLICGDSRRFFGGISIDSRTIKSGELFISVIGNNFDGHKFIKIAKKKGARGAVISKDVSLSFPPDFLIIRVNDTTAALGKIANFHRLRFKIPIIAVTGSNGKTTTKEMLAFVLKKRYKVLSSLGTNNNQIGVPLTLLKLKPTHQMAVLEFGTNHFGEIEYLRNIAQPTIAIITNIGPSHLDFFKNLYNVYKEKLSLIKTFVKGQLAIINRDDKYLSRISSYGIKCKVVGFGVESKCDFKAEGIAFQENRIKFLLNAKIPLELKTLAYHNIYNCLAIIACCKYLHLGYNCIQAQLKKFCFPSGRLEVKNFKNITVIDDTYNSNPSSLKNAIDSLSNLDSFGRKVLICADMLELGKSAKEFHLSLGKYAANSGVDLLISVGRLASLISKAALKTGIKKEMVFHFPDTQSALKRIPNMIRANDTVLVKGSRMMRMEKVVEALAKARF